MASLQSEVDALKATVADGAKEPSVVTHLRTLDAKSVTVDLLLKTGVGKVVRRLRKHPRDPRVNIKKNKKLNLK